MSLGDAMSPQEYIEAWTERLERVEKMVVKMNKDMYEGDGFRNPSIVTRLFRLEEALNSAKWAVRLVVATLVVAVINIILHFVPFK